MRRRKYLGLAGTAATGLLAGCGGNSGSGTTESGPITIGGIEPTSGPFAPWATAHKLGMNVALDEINSGDTLDRELQFKTTDTKSDAGEADSAFRRYVEQDDAVAITGAVSSDVGIRVAQTAEELETTHFLHMSGSQDALSKDSRYSFRVGFLTAPSHVRADIDLIESRSVSSVGAIVADYAWGQSAKSNMEDLMPDDVDLHIEVAPLKTSDFKSYLRKMPDDMEMLSLLGHPAGAISATKQAFELGIDATILGVDPPQSAVISALGSDVTNDILTRTMPDITSDGFEQLGKTVAEKGDKVMYGYESHGYVTGRMIGEAVAEEGTDTKAIADYVRSNSFDLLYLKPIEYAKWGEFEKPQLQYSKFVEGAPSYDSSGDYRLEEVATTDPLPTYEPE